MRSFKIICVSVILFSFFILCQSAFAHSGGLDANGGHYNRKTGEYHYHRGSASVSKSSDSSNVAKEKKNRSPKAEATTGSKKKK